LGVQPPASLLYGNWMPAEFRIDQTLRDCGGVHGSDAQPTERRKQARDPGGDRVAALVSLGNRARRGSEPHG